MIEEPPPEPDPEIYAAAGEAAEKMTSSAGDALVATTKGAARAIVGGVDFEALPAASDLIDNAQDVQGFMKRRAAKAAARGLRRLGESTGMTLSGPDVDTAVTDAIDNVVEQTVDAALAILGREIVSTVTGATEAAADAADGAAINALPMWADLADKHEKLMTPVGWISKATPYLTPIVIPPTPIPLSVVLVAALLGWTIGVTADILDSSGWPDFLDGLRGGAAD